MKITAPSIPLRRYFATAFGSIALLVLATSCATSRPSNWTPSQYLELRSSPGVSTVHFPRGLYVLSSEDSDGFYYAAPAGVVKHTFAGAQRFDGGIFVSRRNPNKLRGYIIWAGGRTHIGDLSRQPHAFRD